MGEPSADELRTDRALRHITERILVQLVEVAVSVNSHIAASQLGRAPADYRQSFDLAAAAGAVPAELAERLRAAAGLRTVLVHEYLEIDLALVAESVPQARGGFGAYVREVARFVQRAEAREPARGDETTPDG